MSLLDWLIVIVPTAFVMWLGFYSRKYVHGVADFLSAGRCARRYVISMGDVASALSVTGLIAYVEVHYKTGFAIAFWNSIIMPLGIVMSLYGYCSYRFRETKAMSLGQFLEMRYNRPFRIFASALRSISEMLCNMIMPAVAARFFIYFLDLPHTVPIFGYQFPTFLLVIIFCLILAISLICFGGTLAMLIADAVQGMVLFPLMVIFVLFILIKFSWTDQIIPVMSDRVAGESFLNSYDIKNLRDFNLLLVFLTVVTSILHRASWIGAGYSTAAKSPHEQKMAGLLGSWRGALNGLFYVLVALGIIAMLNHQDFSKLAKDVKIHLSGHIATELVSPANRADFMKRISAIPEQKHRIGVDAPLSHKQDLDTVYMKTAHQAFKEYEIQNAKAKITDSSAAIKKGEAEGNSKFQQYRTLYYQLMIANGMHKLLPQIMMGLFCLLMVLAMISTDDTRIFSASLTVTQDVILPFCKKDISPKAHINLLRWVSIGVGVFYAFGSTYMSQLDYLNLFTTIMTMMWMGGCGPVMIFGLYSRFGNTCGAFASLVTGMILALGGIFVQRNWADLVYPFLANHGWVESFDYWLRTISGPLNPYVVWKMDPVKFPINSYEIYLVTMFITLFIYISVSVVSRWITGEELFNLDRMLHRGAYAEEGASLAPEKMTFRRFFSKMIGITPQYTKGDRIIAWSIFWYSFFYKFILCFVLVVIWNAVSPWPMAWWGHYFFITILLVPGTVAFVSTFWFGIGGAIDLFRLFRDLENREADVLDNGLVEGNVSLADKARFEKIEAERKQQK